MKYNLQFSDISALFYIFTVFNNRYLYGAVCHFLDLSDSGCGDEIAKTLARLREIRGAGSR